MATKSLRSLSQIQKQIAMLEREAEVLRRREAAGVIQRIRLAIAEYGITAADLGLDGGGSGARQAGMGGRMAGKAKAEKLAKADKPEKTAKAGRKTGGRGSRPGRGGVAGSKVAVKYRDEAGNTWTGRGSQPRWMRDALGQGKKLEDFLIR